MENTDHVRQVLALMDKPAFYVCGGRILCANHAALSRMVPEGAAVAPLLGACRTEYERFCGGSLSLPITVGGTGYCASVERLGDGDIFLLCPDSTDEELRSLALAAQQLRLPLNQLLNTADDLFSRLSGGSEQDDRQMAAMNRSLYQMLRIVLNMSDAHQTTSARMELQDLTAVLQEVFDQASQLLPETGVGLHFVNLPRSIYSLADSSRLERAVFNLISNALKHTPAGGVLEAALTTQGSRLYLTVCNPGGVPGSAAGAFSRFLREPGIGDSRSGLGLGMRLVQSAAAAHGGTVLMEPAPDGGMKVTMSLSIRQNADALRAPLLRIDYAGERSHALIELSEQLPGMLYLPQKDSD